MKTAILSPIDDLGTDLESHLTCDARVYSRLIHRPACLSCLRQYHVFSYCRFVVILKSEIVSHLTKFFLLLLKILIYLFIVCARAPECIYVHNVCIQDPVEVRKCQIPWNWRFLSCCVALESKPESSGSALSALTSCTISPASTLFF